MRCFRQSFRLQNYAIKLKLCWLWIDSTVKTYCQCRRHSGSDVVLVRELWKKKGQSCKLLLFQIWNIKTKRQNARNAFMTPSNTSQPRTQNAKLPNLWREALFNPLCYFNFAWLCEHRSFVSFFFCCSALCAHTCKHNGTLIPTCRTPRLTSNLYEPRPEGEISAGKTKNQCFSFSCIR